MAEYSLRVRQCYYSGRLGHVPTPSLSFVCSAALHFHSSAYNIVFFGTKHWLLTPPRFAGISGAASTTWRDKHAPRDLPAGAGLPIRCAQGPGDMVVVPHHWGHATVNDAFSVGVGDLFCDTRLSHLIGDAHCGHPYASLRAMAPRERIEQLWANVTGHAAAHTRSKGKRGGAGGGSGRGAAGKGWLSRGGLGRRLSARRSDLARRLSAVDALLQRRPGASGSANTAHGALSSARVAPRHDARNLAGSRRAQSTGATPPSMKVRTLSGVARRTSSDCVRGGANYSSVGFVHINKAGGTWMVKNKPPSLLLL